MLVGRIRTADGTEREIDEMLELLEANVPHPEVSDLIFWPRTKDPTSEQIVDEALAYKPIAL